MAAVRCVEEWPRLRGLVCTVMFESSAGSCFGIFGRSHMTVLNVFPEPHLVESGVPAGRPDDGFRGARGAGLLCVRMDEVLRPFILLSLVLHSGPSVDIPPRRR